MYAKPRLLAMSVFLFDLRFFRFGFLFTARHGLSRRACEFSTDIYQNAFAEGSERRGAGFGDGMILIA
jgi:hypothetical protein